MIAYGKTFPVIKNPVKEYFVLQYKRSNRKLKDFGIEPLLGYLLISGIFLGISNHFFEKYDFAPWLYILASLSLTATLSERRRNDFLKFCFSKKDYRLIRVIENLTSSSPFFAVLLYSNFYLPSLLLFGGTLLLGFLNFKKSYSLTVPTPFYKKPFEFIVGFRKTFLLFPLAYGLTIIAISVNNYNLGIFALLLVFLTTITYHLKPENEYYVWAFSLTPEQFLWEKIKTALVFSLLLALPVILALAFSFIHYFDMLLIVLLLASGFLITVILAKYSVYPEEMNVPQGLLLVLCLIFPPFLFVVLPYFFTRSKKKLSILLNDTNK